MKEIIGKAAKAWWWTFAFSLIIGIWLGGFFERNRVYNDCRYAGVTRMGEAAFKCEQFSKVVLLMPEELSKKDKK